MAVRTSRRPTPTRRAKSGGNKFARAGINKVKTRATLRPLSFQQIAKREVELFEKERADALKLATLQKRQAAAAKAREALAAKRTRQREIRLQRERYLGSARAQKGLAEFLMQAPPHNSSNVNLIGYDATLKVLRILFNSGSLYEYEEVPEDVVIKIRGGKAACTTAGENQWGKWWVSKSPSVGAAVYRYIVKGPYKYRLVYFTAARPALRVAGGP